MSIYLLTGHPGAGKSTVAVEHAINRYAPAGRRVACNFPLDFAPVCRRRNSKISRAVIEVVPDRPTRADLDALGVGGELEETAGLLIIDEAGTWLNARSWQGGEREKIIDWLTQSRKRRWDVCLISQSPSMLDKQVREACCELVARIRRLDRVRLLGVRLPRIHFAIVRYGLDGNGPVVERWIYRGTESQKCFGSYRLFGADDAAYSVLPATLSKWRYVPRNLPETVVAYLRGDLRRERLAARRRAIPAKPRRVQRLMLLPPDERMAIARDLLAIGAL